jgi:hypothetical protein
MTKAQANPELLQLREQVETLRMREEVASLRREVQAAELENLIVREAWGDRVDMSDRLYDQTDILADPYSGISRPEDRRDGDFAPIFRTEQELAQIRGVARYISHTHEVAAPALESLTNYVVGDGFSVEVSPRPGVSLQLATAAQAFLDDFIETNGITGDLDRELFQRLRRDGEYFLWLQDRGGGKIRARVVEPDFVTQPSTPNLIEDYYKIGPGLEWKYGIAADLGDATVKHGYFVSWHGDAQNWDYVHDEDMIHAKINTPRSVKRGLSDFYVSWHLALRSTRLLDNIVGGASVQASIAFIRKHAATTSQSQIASMKSAIETGKANVRTDTGFKRVPEEKFGPGLVVDTNNMDYHAGPLGSPNGPALVDVLQASYRVLGIRWSMPEYLISGDASNNNFASALVAESPFTKACQAKQNAERSNYRRLFWRALRMAAESGALPCRPSQIKQLLNIEVTAPEIEVRNQIEDHQMRKEEYESGIRSPRSWASDVGLDYDEERRKGAKSIVNGGISSSDPIRETATESLSELWRGYPR